MKKYLILGLFLALFLPNFTFAQDLDPCFEADVVKGCSPLTVSMEDCSGADPTLIFYDYGEGDGPTTNTTHTYTKAGTYSVKQLINSGSGGKELLREDYIEVLDGNLVDFSITACANNTVLLTINDTFYDEYLIDFGDGNTTTVAAEGTTSHQYSDNGSYTISASGFFQDPNNTCGIATQEYEPAEDLQPAAIQAVTLQNNGDIVLHFDLPSAVEYTLERSTGGAFQNQATLNQGATSHTVSGLNISLNNTINFRISAADVCGGDPILSNVMNVTFLELTGDETSNTLTWTKSELADFASYQILKNGTVLQTINNAETTSFTDSDVNCGQENCYQVKAILTNGESASQTLCQTTVSNTKRPPIEDVLATVNLSNQVELSWTIPTGQVAQQIVILHTENGGTTQERLGDGSSLTTYTDTDNLAHQNSYCYQVKYRDACNESEASQTTCPVFLQGSQSTDNNTLNWSDYQGVTGGDVRYFVERIEANGNIISETEATGNNFSEAFNPDLSDTFIYRIRAEFANGKISYSNTVSFETTAPNQPCFEADTLKGCVPFTVRLNNCSGADDALVQYDFGEGFTSSNTYTFADTGSYTIRQVLDGKELVKQNYITVYDTLPIEYEMTPCPDMLMTLEIKDNYYDRYIIEYGDGETDTTEIRFDTLSHQYADTLLKTVSVRGIFKDGADNCSENFQTFKPILRLEPPYMEEVQVIDTTTLHVYYELPEYGDYVLQKSTNGGAFSDFKMLANDSTLTIVSGINLLDDYCSFRIAISNLKCPLSEGDGVIPALHNTFLFVEGLGEPHEKQSNLLEWFPQAPIPEVFLRYLVYRDGSLIQTIEDVNQTTYEDDSIACDTEYQYKVICEIDFYGQVATSVSNKFGILTGNTQPRPIENFNVSVTETAQVEVSWDEPANAEEIILYRIDSQGDTTEVNLASSSYYLDQVYAEDEQFCYQLAYRDGCGNSPEKTDVKCPMLLQEEEDGGILTLTWTDYDFGTGDSLNIDSTLVYVLEKMDEDGQVYETDTLETLQALDSLEGNDRQIIVYRIKVCHPDSAELCVYSNPVTLFINTELEIPNAFTPNGDGLNDTFGVVSKFVVEFKLTIFNIWGNPIFNETGREVRWDGTIKGRAASPGTYTYSLVARDTQGRIYKRQGQVVLVK